MEASSLDPSMLNYCSPQFLDAVGRWVCDLGSIFNEELTRSFQSASLIDNRRSQREVMKHATRDLKI